MRKLIKYLSYAFVVVGSFFVLCNDGYAKTFTRSGTDLIDEYGYYGSFRKYDDNGNDAYCSDQPLGFYGTCETGSCVDTHYSFDNEYSNANLCTYQVNGVTKNDGDCSKIVGYIIHVAHSDSNYNADMRWLRAQITMWMYLANFSYGDLKWQNSRECSICGNFDESYWWDRYSWAREYVSEAWKQYSLVHNVSLNTERDDVNFSLNYNDKTFYYQPSMGSCDSGFYRTEIFKITNNETNFSINVDVSTRSNNVEVCYVKRNGVADCSSRKAIEIMPNSSIEVFLKSNDDEVETVQLDVNATYSSGERQEQEIFDSERYIPPSELTGIAQGMIVLKEGSFGIKHISSKSINFSKTKIERLKCGDDSNKGNGSKTSPVSKVCADKSDSKKDYLAEFSGCTCLGLDLGNNRYVSIVVTENADFSFGKLTPSGTLYAGGGFGFAENGVITQYVAKVTWDYANNKSNGVPYYYNGNNLKDNDARNIENEINEALKKRLKDKLSLDFYTRDSNDYLNKSMVVVPLTLDVSNIQFTNRVYELNSNAMKMNEAYFSSDGRVSYNDNLPNNTYSIRGGNKYYVPMGYSEGIFPFDISVSNLSIVDGIDFWYKADCDKEVKDLYKSLYYRSIDLDNPFPKANNLTANVPENWKFWYCGTSRICNNLENRNRLENTYQNYPNGPLYEIVLNSDKFKKINAMTDYYTSWSNVNKDGVSSFVTDMDLFEAYASNKSYCPIGKFSKECDDK